MLLKKNAVIPDFSHSYSISIRLQILALSYPDKIKIYPQTDLFSVAFTPPHCLSHFHHSSRLLQTCYLFLRWYILNSAVI